MSRDGTLGSMLQGVSQQPTAVRPEGKVTEQINFVSDVVQGLSARPALMENADLPPNVNADFYFTDVTIGSDTYILAYKPGALSIWTTAGVSCAVTEEDGALSYIGTEMQSYVFEDNLYMNNRAVVTAVDATLDTSTVVINNGHISVLGGLFNRQYTALLTYPDGTEVSVSYQTPDGNTSGDGNKSRATYIADQLTIALNADPALKVTTTVTRYENTIYIVDTAENFALSVSDDDGGDSMRAHTDTVESIEDLAKFSVEGALVKVTGNDEGTADDFWLRFKVKTPTAVGTGLGTEGVWEEWFNPFEVNAFDLTTMPHVLERTGPTAFTLKQGPWFNRRVGDEETNPMPEFIGHSIRDIGGFQSRLVFVAGPWLALSRTNTPTDFFKESALTELDTDPIITSSTEEGTVRLDWIIPFDRDLVIMSDPGAGQFVVSGSSKITASNASLVKTTAFEMRGGAKPVETGRTILFPFKSGKFSGIKEFFTNDEVATNGADTLTETLDRYIVGLVNRMRCSTNFNLAVFTTDSPDHTTTVWTYKYLWQESSKLQSAWSKWEFPHTVRHMFFKDSELYVVMSKDGSTPGETLYLFGALDLDLPVDDVAGYHISLDRQLTRTADAQFQITLPYDNAAFVQSTGCATPGRPVDAFDSVTVGDATTYTFLADTVPEGAELVCGLKYKRVLVPTMPRPRDRQGNVLPRAHVVVTSFLLEYEDTGYIKADMTSRYRVEDTSLVMDLFPIDNDPTDPEGAGTRSGVLEVPWGERADWSELTLSSDDVRPTTFIELEWTGQVFRGSTG